MRNMLAITTVLGALASGNAAAAAEYGVKMLNKGSDGPMVFEPSLLKIQPGDTVRFVPADKGHNVVSIEGMMPEGTQPFTSKMSQGMVVTFDKPGIYGYECKPHCGMGMVGMIVVGDASANLDSAMSMKDPGKAMHRFEDMFHRMAN